MGETIYEPPGPLFLANGSTVRTCGDEVVWLSEHGAPMYSRWISPDWLADGGRIWTRCTEGGIRYVGLNDLAEMDGGLNDHQHQK